MIIPNIHTVEGAAIAYIAGAFTPSIGRKIKSAIVKLSNSLKAKVKAEAQTLDKKL